MSLKLLEFAVFGSLDRNPATLQGTTAATVLPLDQTLETSAVSAITHKY
jgi:hypothetical protein